MRSSSFSWALLLVILTAVISCDTKHDPNDNTCPKCNSSDQVVPIVYGLPTKETFIRADSGKVMLGGCVVEEDSPNWHCKRDGERF